MHLFQKSTFPLLCEFTVPDLYLHLGPAISHTTGCGTTRSKCTFLKEPAELKLDKIFL